MLSKNKIKLFNSLKLRKYRKKHSLFVVEGAKITKDFILSGYLPRYIISENNDLKFYANSKVEFIYAKKDDIKKISSLKTVSETIAVFDIPEYDIDYASIKEELVLFCDGIQNPGNLGTIIRTADWFGIKNIFCSDNTVDAYNSKVVQASMGAICRVKVHYVDAISFFLNIDKKIIVYGTFLDGENIYETNLTKSGIVVIGNEGSGISEKLEKYILKRIKIPNYSENTAKTESLNASIAAAIVCAEFRRIK